MSPSGNIFFEDEYGTQYQSTWQSVNGAIDITTISRTPYVWGADPQGYRQGNRLYRLGMISTHRQVLQILEDGYAIIAEGMDQRTDYFPVNFPCGSGPFDPFAYHVNCAVSDRIEMRTTEGPHWSDPDDADDMDAIWGVVDSDGTVDPETTATGGADILEWIDVWE